jgi:hypothetical protein
MPKRKRTTRRKRSASGRFVRAKTNPRRKTVTRKRRRSRRPYSVAHYVRRNPRRKGPLSMLGIDEPIFDIVGGTVITVGSRLLPSYLSSVVKLPTTGFAGYGVQLASGLGLSWVVEKVLKQKGMAKLGRLLTVVNVLTRFADDMIFKGESMGSLLGLNYPPGAYARPSYLETERMLGQGEYWWTTPGSYSGNGVGGQYTPGPEVERMKSRY